MANPSELPPRARRILLRFSQPSLSHGTTSACAENTLHPTTFTPKHRNYLRVRGEYLRLMEYRKALLELPPRARRIRRWWHRTHCHTRTTSACAENTHVGFGGFDLTGNYLRVRGEYHFSIWATGMTWELPPRARRILPRCQITDRDDGTTSACAENTASSLRSADSNWNYLRVRGEYRQLGVRSR